MITYLKAAGDLTELRPGTAGQQLSHLQASLQQAGGWTDRQSSPGVSDSALFWCLWISFEAVGRHRDMCKRGFQLKIQIIQRAD